MIFILCYCYNGNSNDVIVYDTVKTQTNDYTEYPVSIDLNTASAKELESLIYINMDDAQAIIEYRDKIGGFKKVEDVRKVKGITLIKQKVIIDNCFIG